MLVVIIVGLWVFISFGVFCCSGRNVVFRIVIWLVFSFCYSSISKIIKWVVFFSLVNDWNRLFWFFFIVFVRAIICRNYKFRLGVIL